MRYDFAEYELDTTRFELRRAGIVAPIEPQVFDLLRHLIEHRDRVVTKNELFEKVWSGRSVSDATLSSRIKAARQAIGDDGTTQNWIQTIHGRGFRFVGNVRGHSDTAALRSDARASLRQDIRYCTARDGTRIAYARIGTGPPLVKTPNWLTHLEYDWESPIWRHWISGLAQGRELIRYDERGNGLSDRNVADVSFQAMVNDLEAVVDACQLDRFALIGISRGCSISVEYAARNPDRLTHLILYGGFPKGWRHRPDPDGVGLGEAMSTLIRRGWDLESPAFRQLFTSLFMPDATADQADWFNDLQRMTIEPETAYRLHEEIGRIDVSQQLAQVTVPTLVLHARDDKIVPLRSGQQFASNIPGARFVGLDSRNHILLEHENAFRHLLEEIELFINQSNPTD